jgi:hypothetical protein
VQPNILRSVVVKQRTRKFVGWDGQTVAGGCVVASSTTGYLLDPFRLKLLHPTWLFPLVFLYVSAVRFVLRKNSNFFSKETSCTQTNTPRVIVTIAVKQQIVHRKERLHKC